MVTRSDLFQFIETHYDETPKFLWKKFPNYAAFRHKNDGKWFGLVMDVTPEKFGLAGNEKLDILNLKSPPELNGGLRERDDIFAGYHMDKEHWNTIILSRVKDIKDIEGFIEKSFELTKK